MRYQHPPPVVLDPLLAPNRDTGDMILTMARRHLNQSLATMLDLAAAENSDPVIKNLSPRDPEIGLDETNSCANFVSACLRAAGLTFRKITGVARLRDDIEASANWTTVYTKRDSSATNVPPAVPPGSPVDLGNWFAANASGGDVVILHTDRDGDNGHAVFYAGTDSSGEPLFIGANGDPQVVTELTWSEMANWISGCEVTGVYHYDDPPPATSSSVPSGGTAGTSNLSPDVQHMGGAQDFVE